MKDKTIILPDREEDLGIELFDPDGKYICHIYTSIQLYDIRCQIKEKSKLDSIYTFTLKGNTYEIDSHGRIERDAFLEHENVLDKFGNYLNRLM